MLLRRIDAYFFAIAANALETNLTIDQSKQSIIRTTANVFTGMDVSTALTNQNVASQYMLTIGTFYAQTFGLGITAVLGGTYTFFMCKKLQA